MAKISADRLRGISALPKILTLEFEKDGIKEKSEIDIYPFTVQEKSLMKIKSEDLEKMDINSLEYSLALEKNAYDTVYMILQKSVDGITIDDIKNFPVEWLEKIIQKTLSHEGVTEEQFQDFKKKEK